MIRLSAGFIFLAALAGTPLFAQAPGVAPVFAIVNVTVIDVENGGHLDDRTVVVNGNRIATVGPATQVAVPAGTRVVDGRGRFLIPGLWDMHVHSLELLGVDYSYGMEPYKLYVAEGVTGVRDMGSSFIQFFVGKNRIESQQLVAPRIVASGPLLEGGDPPLIRAIISKYVPTPESGRLAVDTLAEAGLDFIKIHNGLSRETYLAIAEEAKRRDIVFAGHVPDDVSVTEASDLGQRSIEHLAPLTAICTDPKALDAAASEPDQFIPIKQERCRAALEHLARNGTWLGPTLISSFPMTEAAHGAELEAEQRYIEPERRARCSPPPARERPGARARYEFNLRVVQMAREAGVRMLPATDTTTCRVPGFATLRELELFVEAGLSPLDSLRTATVNVAAYFNRSDSLGSIARGKLADMVLLDGDPLVDISNIRRIAAVVADGRLFEGAERQQLLDDVLAAQ